MTTMTIPALTPKRALFALALGGVALLGACATQTAYAPRDQSGYGFAETRIEPNRFRVSFSGNSMTSQETVEKYMLYRSAELTLQQGFDWFEVVDRDTASKSHVVGTGPYYGPWGPGFYPSPFHYRYYHPTYGWYPWYDPFWNDMTYQEITRYQAEAEIFMGKGKKSDSPRAYDARQVQANLGPQIQYPQPG
jgi:hypothetical protein